jgi:hypothetical protein
MGKQKVGQMSNEQVGQITHTPLKEVRQIRLKKVHRKFLLLYHTIGGNITKTSAMLKYLRAAFYSWCAKYPLFLEIVESIRDEMLDVGLDSLMANVKEGREKSVFYLLDNLGAVRGFGRGNKNVSRTERDIVLKFKRGESDIQELAADYALNGIAVPDGIRALISKIVIPEAVVALTSEFTDADLEAQYQESMKKIEKEEGEWLPKRKEKVEAMKAEIELQESGKAPGKDV